jgi:hypothetical protein
VIRAAAALALLLLGCASLPERPQPRPDEGPWGTIRTQNTRNVKLYDGLAVRAFATATWDSPAAREARAARVADWKAMSPAEREAWLSAERAAAAGGEEFTLALFTPERADNDLALPGTAWRVALVRADGTESLPVRVEEVRADTLLRTLYPAIGDFDVVYRLRFEAAPPLASPFTLRLAGPRGQIDFPY